jgi:basic membrane protein A and related proteins
VTAWKRAYDSQILRRRSATGPQPAFPPHEANCWAGPAYLEAAEQTLAETWKPTARWRGLGPGGFVKMTTQNPALPAEVRALMDEKQKAIIEGKLHPFTGPIKDQSGKERVAAGQPIPDSELAGINWLVDGVQGTLPRT